MLSDVNNDEELINFLSGIALSPETLCPYIKRYKEVEVADRKWRGRMIKKSREQDEEDARKYAWRNRMAGIRYY